MENQFELILLLLALATGITAIAKKLDQPYPIALVIVGAMIGLLPIHGLENLKAFIVEDEVFRFAIISIFLPTLLGEATLKLPFYHLSENKKPILALAFAGTLISFLAAGYLSFQFLGLPIQTAFVFASLMAATDPVSVLSIFKSMGVDHRLSAIMEGESLANDGVAVVLFTISSVYLLEYMELGWVGVALGGWTFLKVVFGGVAIGTVLAYLFSYLTKLYDDYPLEVIFSMILFYGSFFIAEHFHVSGVIAVVVAGLIFGNYGARIGMSPTTKLNIRTFWDVAAQLANSLVFLMVGLEITRIEMWFKWEAMLLAILIVLIARSMAVYGSLAWIRNLSPSWQHIANWGGLKGSLSIALALSLPHSFTGREDIIALSFAVVLFSLVVQGLSIKPLVSMLGVRSNKQGVTQYEQAISLLHRSQAARNELLRIKNEGSISTVVFETLDQEYQRKIDEAYSSLESLYDEYPALQSEQKDSIRRQLLFAEHQAVEQLSQKHIISDNMATDQSEEILDLIEKVSKQH